LEEKLVRFGVTIPESVLKEFDQRLRQSGKGNRSDALRGLIRRYITDERWQENNGSVFGTVTMMYDHHGACISKDLTALQHDFGEIIVCTTHVHVTHNTCMECIVLRGTATVMRNFIESLGRIKGLKSIDTVITSSI
jgi:CopG family nickel-responsive transcriptional regulator